MRGNSGFCARRRDAVADLSQYFCRGVAGHDGRGYDTPSRGLNFFAANDLVSCPIAAFHKNVWEQSGDGALWRKIVENHHAIDAFKRGQNFRALPFGNHRATLAFELFDAGIAVQTDDQRVTQAAGMFEAADVAGMQQVEAAVGEHDAATVAFVAAKPQNRLLQCEDGIQKVSMRAQLQEIVKPELVVYHAGGLRIVTQGTTR